MRAAIDGSDGSSRAVYTSAASSLAKTPVLVAINASTAVVCRRARNNATCSSISETLPSCRNAVARETPAIFATTSICTALIPRAEISVSAALINRSLTVPSSPAVTSTTVTTLRLRDRAGDLEFYEAVVVHPEFAHHVVGVFGELRGAPELRLGVVELHRAGHQLLRISFGINDVGDPAVREQAFVMRQLPGILHRCPLSGAPAEHLLALGEAQLPDGVVDDAVCEVCVLGHRCERCESRVIGELIKAHQPAELRPVSGGLQHRQLDEPAVGRAVGPGQWIARGLSAALHLGQRPTHQHRHVYAELSSPGSHREQ